MEFIHLQHVHATRLLAILDVVCLSQGRFSGLVFVVSLVDRGVMWLYNFRISTVFYEPVFYGA